MIRAISILILSTFFSFNIYGQQTFPLDTIQWEINAQSYVLESYKGKDALYMQRGMAALKDVTFLNGTIEFDVFLTERQGFPGVRFRAVDANNMESFYIRAHLPGKPDANQGTPVINGLSPWQLYFGPSYSVPYDYNYDDWTHVKLVVNGKRAQVFFDYSEKPHLCWNLVREPKEGRIAISGGGPNPMHYANFTIDKTATQLVDFKVHERKPIDGLVSAWEISDKFEETQLDNLANIKGLITSRKWLGKVQIEEGAAANIARKVLLRDGTKKNTVFAKLVINSDKEQTKLFEFGYSDRAVAILNDQPIYKGNNRWRSRDYRYLGTIGLFDAVYLNLKKGKNILLLAVSEDFGGWLVTGKFTDPSGVVVN